MMIARIDLNNTTFNIDLSKPLDISIPMHALGPRAWYAAPMRISPVLNQYFTGSVALGGNVNFNDIFFNPHAHGTHTETLGHISRELVSIENALTRFWWLAALVSITPHVCTADNEVSKAGDSIITLEQLQQALSGKIPEALIIRTLPNSNEKKSRLYSNTNFTYMQPNAAQWLAQQGVQHLLVDMPSIDREEDQGRLLAHHAFWNYPSEPRQQATITEMIYAENSIDDGLYMLNMQVASFRNDAAPSRPVLYKLFNN
jgi:kynurenine formamidase